MINGLFDLSVWELIIVTLVLTHITIASVTIYLHRHQTHGSITLHPVVSHFFRFWLWITTGMVTKEWVAVHRKHHAKCETEEDPHSPQIHGIKKLLGHGVVLYQKEAVKQETLDQYGQGTPTDWLERHLYGSKPIVGVVSMGIINLICFGPIGLTIFAIQMLWIPFWAAGVINGVGHYWGYRSFETSDASRNIFPIGIFIGGEEFHNNHHAYASSAKLSNKWWEIDIGWFYICVLKFLRLAEVKRVAPVFKIKSDKSLIDIETAKAVVRNRVHIMALYGKTVIQPVIEQECQNASQAIQRLFKKSRKLMIREDITLNHNDESTLSEAFDNSATLETVYQFKQNLKDIWQRSHSSYEARVAKLQEWCQQAEQTGIKVLQDFAQAIRGYTLQFSEAPAH